MALIFISEAVNLLSTYHPRMCQAEPVMGGREVVAPNLKFTLCGGSYTARFQAARTKNRLQGAEEGVIYVDQGSQGGPGVSDLDTCL